MQDATGGADQTSLLTEDQIQIALRLESIFMPHARRQRDETHRKQHGDARSREPIRFAHYTSTDAALQIIKSKRVWMRNATCMSDYREVQHGFDILQRYFADKSRTDAFVGALDACVPGAAMEAINTFNQWYTSVEASIRFHTYIASISEHQSAEDQHGRLSMWRAFGGNTARVAIVLSIPWYTGAALALNIMFSPVAYLTENAVHSVISEVIANVSGNFDFLRSLDRSVVVQMVFHMLLAGVTCLKHEGFREELEWRVIYTPKIRSSQLIELSTEVIAGVPQPIHKLPLDASVSSAVAGLDLARVFDRVIIGPSPYPWAMYEAFVGVLRGISVPKPEERVFVSGIPIRG